MTKNPPDNVLCVSLNPAVDVACEAASVQPTHKIRTTHESHYPGGGAVNVARVIKTLGGEPRLLFLQGGATGALLDDRLGALGIDRQSIPIEEPTRIAFNVYERSSGHEFRFVPEGPTVDESDIEKILAYIRQQQTQWVVLSGSLPRGVRRDTYARISAIVNDYGGRVVLDCAGAELRTTLQDAQVFLAKPSIGELEAFSEKELDEPAAKQVAAELIQSGAVQHLALSMGAQGAFLFSRNRILRAPSIRVHVRSAVGAGDSFLGAMVHTLSTGENLETAFRSAVAAGAAAVTTPGTELVSAGEIAALLPICQIIPDSCND